MENILLPSPAWYEPLIFLLCFIGLAVMRATNSDYLLVITGLHQFAKKGTKASTENIASKSSVFLSIGSVLITSVWIKIGFHISAGWSLVIATLYFFSMLGVWTLFNKIMLDNSETENFPKNRLLLTEANAIITFGFVLIHFYLQLPLVYLSIFILVTMLIIWTRAAQLLLGRLSISHIILYLCALEILPFFIMIKAIIKYLM